MPYTISALQRAVDELAVVQQPGRTTNEEVEVMWGAAVERLQAMRYP